ncbi:hypothetical protein MUP05_05455 [Candidatus Bathyarchaeota archaeon]|nr:hypothetical protein [Candidatus Bathyarchaeota archaeon]
MVKFGTTTLPLVLEVEELQKLGYTEKFVSGASIAKRIVRGKYGGDYLIRGLITSDFVNQKAALRALADGNARAVDFEDGSPAVPCLMLDPRFHDTEKRNQVSYEARFVQSA